MIDEVIICGIRRNNELIPMIEIEQSIGRAGRSYTKNGSAIILVSKYDESKAFDYLFEECPDIQSQMNEISELSFHFLPVVYRNKFVDKDLFEQWYSKTLSCLQGKKVTYKKVCDYLIENECAYMDNKKLHCSDLGVLSCNYFVYPSRIKALKDKIKELPIDYKNRYCLSWMLAYDVLNVCELGDGYDEFIYSCKRNDCFFEQEEAVHGFVYYCIFSNVNHPLVKFQISQEKNNIDRILNVAKSISIICGNGELSEYLTIVLDGLTKNMSPEVAEFSKLTGIESKAEINKLFELEIRTIEDIAKKERIIKSNSNKKTISLLEKHWRI